MTNGNSREEKLFSLEMTRLIFTFLITVVGLGVAAWVVIILLPLSGIDAQGIAAVVGLFTSVLGTIVGAFLGLQIGLGGKAEADAGRFRALSVAMEAIEIVKRTDPGEAAKLSAKLP
jgi:hypothetical protein